MATDFACPDCGADLFIGAAGLVCSECPQRIIQPASVDLARLLSDMRRKHPDLAIEAGRKRLREVGLVCDKDGRHELKTP